MTLLLTLDLPPRVLASLKAAATESGRTPAEEAVGQLAASLGVTADGPEVEEAGLRELEAALGQKVSLIRSHPDGLPPDVPDPFADAFDRLECGAGGRGRAAA